jgi:hypothetical protein
MAPRINSYYSELIFKRFYVTVIDPTAHIAGEPMLKH